MPRTVNPEMVFGLYAAAVVVTISTIVSYRIARSIVRALLELPAENLLTAVGAIAFVTIVTWIVNAHAEGNQ